MTRQHFVFIFSRNSCIFLLGSKTQGATLLSHFCKSAMATSYGFDSSWRSSWSVTRRLTSIELYSTLHQISSSSMHEWILASHGSLDNPTLTWQRPFYLGSLAQSDNSLSRSSRKPSTPNFLSK